MYPPFNIASPLPPFVKKDSPKWPRPTSVNAPPKETTFMAPLLTTKDQRATFSSNTYKSLLSRILYIRTLTLWIARSTCALSHSTHIIGDPQYKSSSFSGHSSDPLDDKSSDDSTLIGTHSTYIHC